MRPAAGGAYHRQMALERMDHVGIVVTDLAAAIGFFTDVGLEVEGEMTVEGPEVDGVNGLEGVRSEVVMMRTPGSGERLELARYRSPSGPSGEPRAPANTPGIRHLCFAVDDVDATLARLRDRGAELVGDLVNYKDSYLLCYVRGPEGVIVELAEKIA